MGVEPSFLRNGHVWPVTPVGPLPSENSDPALLLPDGALEKGAREVLERWWLADQNSVLAGPPAEPLGPPPAAAALKRRRWSVAIAASLVFHAAVALFFLEGDDTVLIEGSENAGVTMLGNASEDQVSAGEAFEDATTVTLIETVTARPVETVEAEAVPVAEAAEAVEAEAVEAALAETLQAESETVDPAAAPVETVAPEAPQPTDPVREATAVQPEIEAPQPAPPAAASPAPEILASERIAQEDDATAVPPVAEAPAAEIVDAVEATTSPPAEIAVEAVPEVVAEAVPEAVEEMVEMPEVVAVLPEPRPEPVEQEPKKPVEQERKPVRKPAEKRPPAKAEPRTADKPQEKPVPKAQAKAGSGGRNAGDARRGAADGEVAGTTTAAGKKGQTATAGNASVSNYPGKVVAKLRRALRYPAEARAQRLRGEVQVAFTVSANGSVGGIRVVRSSGSPILDKAAVETVRRAAPFPAIPDGRASWPFTVPLAFVR